MGILDDAIRDHIDLKRKHGARDTELTELEDDAFGTGDRPDPFAAGELFGEGAAAQTETGSDDVPGPDTPPPTRPGGQPASEEPTMLVEPQASPPALPAEAPPSPQPDSPPAPPADAGAAAPPVPQEPATPAPPPAAPTESAPPEPPAPEAPP